MSDHADYPVVGVEKRRSQLIELRCAYLEALTEIGVLTRHVEQLERHALWLATRVVYLEGGRMKKKKRKAALAAGEGKK